MPDEKITTNDLDFWLDHIDDIKNDIIQTVNDIPEERIKYELMKVAATVTIESRDIGINNITGIHILKHLLH